MGWGRFLMVVGSIFATAGLTVILAMKCVLEQPVPSLVLTIFSLGLSVVMLGGLIIYAVPKEREK